MRSDPEAMTPAHSQFTTNAVSTESPDTATPQNSKNGLAGATSETGGHEQLDLELGARLDKFSLEAIVEVKISRFLDQLGTFYPENLHDLIMAKVERPLITQILRRVGGNQVHAARILGINRNTLRKKMKLYHCF